MLVKKQCWFYLAGSFVGAHLKADGGLVVRLVCLCLWVVEMSPGPISSHTSLARTLVGPHLKYKKINKND